jgi:hypothetical protein
MNRQSNREHSKECSLFRGYFKWHYKKEAAVSELYLFTMKLSFIWADIIGRMPQSSDTLSRGILQKI